MFIGLDTVVASLFARREWVSPLSQTLPSSFLPFKMGVRITSATVPIKDLSAPSNSSFDFQPPQNFL